MKVVIIIPTYNEKGNIEKLISHLEEKIFPKIKNHEMHILVADDNSPDKTADEVKSLMKKYKNLDISIGEKKGLGAAYIRGMTYAIEKINADVMFEMDADGQHDPEKISEFLKKIDEGYDMAIGTRYSNGGSIPSNWPPQRKAFSIIGNILVRLILMRFSIHDWTGGYRAIKKEVFLKEKDELTNFKGYTFQVSFLHKAVRDKFKIAEVPFHFTDRTLGNSKIAPKEYIVDLLKYVITAKIIEMQRFIKFLVVGGTGFIVQVITQEFLIFIGLTLFLAVLLDSFLPNKIDTLVFSHALGAGFGAEFAIISNFMFNNFWTFNDASRVKEKSSFIVRLLKFNTTSLLAILIQFSSVWLSEKLFGVNLNLLSYSVPTRIAVLFPTIIFLIIPINYFIYNKFIWKTQYLKNEKTAKV